MIEPSNIRRILIRSTNWIGDAVMTTPAMGAVRAAFPHSEITVAANPATAELLQSHSYCDRVLLYDKQGLHRGGRGFLKFCRVLRDEQFDLAILFQNAMEAALMAFVARIPRRAGWTTDCRGLLLTHGVTLTESDLRLHHTDYYLKMLHQLGIAGGDGNLHLDCSEPERAWARDILGQGTWVAINPGAAYGSAKRWIPERFAAVGDRLSDEFGCQIVLTGGPAERSIGFDISSNMRNRPLNLIGGTSIRQLMALLERCRLVVTNDSGPMHIAAALRVPLVALFGPTDHRTTSPLTSSSCIVRKKTDCAPCLKRQCPKDHSCMKAIEVEDVLNAARTLLSLAR
jgi:heptosyltransferase-2